MKTAEEILKSHIGIKNNWEYAHIECMKEYAAQYIDLAAKRAKVSMVHQLKEHSDDDHTAFSIEVDRGYEDYIPVDFSVNEQSILEIKKELK